MFQGSLDFLWPGMSGMEAQINKMTLHGVNTKITVQHEWQQNNLIKHFASILQ